MATFKSNDQSGNPAITTVATNNKAEGKMVVSYYSEEGRDKAYNDDKSIDQSESMVASGLDVFTKQL